MTLLFAGSEPEAFDFVNSTTGWNTATAAYYDANYARGYIEVREDALSVNFDTDQTEIWVNMRLVSGSAGSGANAVGLRAANGDPLIAIRAFSGSTIQIAHATSLTNWTPIVPSVTLIGNTLYIFTLHYKKVATNQVLMEFFVNGELIVSTTITHAWQGTKLARSAMFGSLSTGAFVGRLSEVVITDTEDPRGWRVATLAPNADGNSVEWNGSYVDIDELGLTDDNDYISSDTPNQTELFGLSNLSAPAQNMAMRALVLSARARKGTTGPQNIQPLVRTGGANFAGANLPDLSGAFSARPTIWEVNPQTGLPWTVAEVQAVEAGFRSLA